MSSESLDVDIEDELDNFIIRRQTNIPKPFIPGSRETKDGHRIHEYIPLLLSDLLDATPVLDLDNVFTVFTAPHNIYFRTCIVHGFIAGRGVNNKWFFKYILDDSTGSMDVSISTKTKDMEVIKSLYKEAVSLKDTPNVQPDTLMRLLNCAHEFIDASVINPGNNLLLLGRPNLYNNKIGLDVLSFLVDNTRSRKYEIAFVDDLINWYNN